MLSKGSHNSDLFAKGFLGLEALLSRQNVPEDSARPAFFRNNHSRHTSNSITFAVMEKAGSHFKF